MVHRGKHRIGEASPIVAARSGPQGTTTRTVALDFGLWALELWALELLTSESHLSSHDRHLRRSTSPDSQIIHQLGRQVGRNRADQNQETSLAFGLRSYSLDNRVIVVQKQRTKTKE